MRTKEKLLSRIADMDAIIGAGKLLELICNANDIKPTSKKFKEVQHYFFNGWACGAKVAPDPLIHFSIIRGDCILDEAINVRTILVNELNEEFNIKMI